MPGARVGKVLLTRLHTGTPRKIVGQLMSVRRISGGEASPVLLNMSIEWMNGIRHHVEYVTNRKVFFARWIVLHN